MVNYKRQILDIVEILNESPPLKPVIIIDGGIGLDSQFYLSEEEEKTAIKADKLDQFLYCCEVEIDPNGQYFLNTSASDQDYNQNVQFYIDKF